MTTKTPWLRGSLVALVTPFADGKVDEEAFRALIRWHIEEGTDGLVPCGTTGEAATLSLGEWETVVGITVEEVAKVGGQVGGRRFPVVAGSGGNSTAATVERTKRAQALGADAALVVTPYYNKPTQEGLVRHYEAVLAGAPGMPLVLYNVPGRTACNLLPDTVARLADHEGILAVKEASGSMDQISELIGKVGDRVAVLSGDDGMNLFVSSAGGTGTISVLGNVVPRDSASMFKALEAGDLAEARRLHHRYHRLVKMLFLETNPQPVKTALALMGRVREEFRLPLCEMSPPNREKLRQTLVEYGLL